MVVAVNEEELIGSLIPDVYIKTITLETAGTVIRETNPHIEHVREFKINTTPSPKTLTTTLDLVLKEKYSSDSIGSWFGNQDFQKYLRLTVVRCSHPLVTKILSASNNAIQAVNMKSAEDQAVFAAELMTELKDLPEFSTFGTVTAAYTEQDIPEILDLIAENTEAKHISVKEMMLNSDKTLLRQKTEFITDNGARVIDFAFRLKFVMPNDKPQHLSYFAVSSIDVDQIIEDFNLDKTDTHLLELMNGKVVLDNVIANGSLVSKTFVFRDQDGQIWSGPVHKEGGTWLTGSPENQNKTPLVRDEIENGKVQDFRNYDDLERTQLNFSVVENSSFNRNLPFQRTTNDNMDVFRRQSYFSEAGLSRDSKGACRFIFSLDYGKMIKDKTRYGALYNQNNLQQLFDNVRIRNFSVLRRRMTREGTVLNQLGSPTEKHQVFDKDEPVEVICRGGESVPGAITMGENIRGTVKEITLDTKGGLPEVRNFTGIDQSMPLVTDGYYQYGVEIEVEDRTDKLILEKINLLSKARYDIEHYYNLSVLPDHFDLLSNKFTEKFIDLMYGKYGWSTDQISILASPWFRPVAIYLEVLSFFRKQPVGFKLASSLWKYTDPKVGNPRGIAMIQKLIDNLAQRIASAVGINLTEKRPPNLSPDADGNFVMPSSVLSPGKPPLKTFKVQYYFPQVFDSNLPKSVGYDYISKGILENESNQDGLRTITVADYRQRVELESLKYFNGTDEDISIKYSNSVGYTEDDNVTNTALTYLSPSNVNLASRGNYSLLSNPFDPEKALRIQSAISAINLAKKSPFVPILGLKQQNPNAASHVSPSQLDIKNNMSSIMSTFGCTLITLAATPLHNLPQLLELDYDPYTDAGDLMGISYESVDQLTFPPILTSKKAANESEPKVDPTSLFASLAFPMYMSGKGMTGVFNNYNLLDSAAKSDKKELLKTFDIGFYNLSNTSGLLSTLESADNPETAGLNQSTEILANNSISEATSQKLAALPNALKSLLLCSTSNRSIRYDWSKKDDERLPKMTKAAFILNYKTLRKTEVFVGYDIDDEGHPMLKSPKWEPLTEQLLESAVDDNLLCRTVKYENKDIGCSEAVGMRMPVYNKYFIISGAGSANVTPAVTSYADKIAKAYNKILRQQQNIRPEYTSSGTVTSKLVFPTSETKASVAENVDLTKNMEKVKVD